MIRLIEIILLELDYQKFVISDEPAKWQKRLRNIFAVGGMLCKWIFKQYSTGFFVAAELATRENIGYYTGLRYLINQYSPEKRRFFDALLVDIYDLLARL
jgi:hypothetical protein